MIMNEVLGEFKTCTCPACKGRGKRKALFFDYWFRCELCNGRGVVDKEKARDWMKPITLHKENADLDNGGAGMNEKSKTETALDSRKRKTEKF